MKHQVGESAVKYFISCDRLELDSWTARLISRGSVSPIRTTGGHRSRTVMMTIETLSRRSLCLPQDGEITCWTAIRTVASHNFSLNTNARVHKRAINISAAFHLSPSVSLSKHSLYLAFACYSSSPFVAAGDLWPWIDRGESLSCDGIGMAVMLMSTRVEAWSEAAWRLSCEDRVEAGRVKKLGSSFHVLTFEDL